MEDKRLLISLYDGCQYHCTFCMYGYVKEAQPLNDKNTMSPQLWYDALSAAYARGFRILEIGGRGEPTLSPIFINVIEMAYDLGFRIELLSNALNDKIIIEILPKIQQLTLNLNAVDERGLSKIHQPAPGFSFDRCLRSVKNVVSAISKNNLDIHLRTNYVVTTQSLKEAFVFPRKLSQLLEEELGGRQFYVAYQHVYNYIKISKALGLDGEGLEKVLALARLNIRDKFMLQNTNLLAFIQKTERLLKRFKPFELKLADDVEECCNTTQYTCDVHKYLLFIDGNGDCYGCYNPFRAVNGLPVDKDPFYFGNLMSQPVEEIFVERNEFYPVMDISSPFWQPCLLCKAVKVPAVHTR
jgi:MoaA/NifB/PqqE/SkfB family radical SAM enzyme